MNQGKKIYLYNADGSILYYAGNSLNEFKDNFNIHPTTLKNGLKYNKIILNSFLVTDKLIIKSKKTELNLLDLRKLILENRNLYLKNLMINKLSIGVLVVNTLTKESLEFSSISNAVSFFKDQNILFDRNKVSECIKTGKPYKNYTFSKKS